MATDPILNLLGKRIRLLRKAKGISQETLAEVAELHPTYISDVERGKVNASVLTFCMIAKALELPVSELLDIPGEDEDVSVSNEMTVILSRVRKLDEKKRGAFFESVTSILTSLEKL